MILVFIIWAHGFLWGGTRQSINQLWSYHTITRCRPLADRVTGIPIPTWQQCCGGAFLLDLKPFSVSGNFCCTASRHRWWCCCVCSLVLDSKGLSQTLNMLVLVARSVAIWTKNSYLLALFGNHGYYSPCFFVCYSSACLRSQFEINKQPYVSASFRPRESIKEEVKFHFFPPSVLTHFYSYIYY